MTNGPSLPPPLSAESPARIPTSGATSFPTLEVLTGRGVAVVLPTYNELDNLEPISRAILQVLPGSELLIVDDASPDGTGALADSLAAVDPRITVLHRPAKEGLGAAYRHAFALVLSRPHVEAVAQMDADFSHDPRDLPRLLEGLADAELALGSRYIAGGGTRGWPLHRRLVSRIGTLFARTVLGLPQADLTGGFKVWRRGLLQTLQSCALSANGYGFQIETTWWAQRCGARIREVPITFSDRVAGASKMSPEIAREAVWLVLGLRWRQSVAAFTGNRVGQTISMRRRNQT